MKSNKIFPWLPYMVFFVFTFIYFGFFSDYVLFYQEKLSLFIFSSDFLIENLKQPGGLLIYLGKFFSTLFYLPVLGSIVISSLLTLTIFTLSRTITILTARDTKIFPFIIGAALFYFQSDYRFLFYNSLGLILQLLLFLVAIKNISGSKWWVILIILPLWYYFTGSFALLFSVMLTFHFLFGKEKKVWIRILAIWIVNLATIYISKEYLFFQTEKVLLIFPFSTTNTGSQQIQFLFVATVLSILPAILYIKIRLTRKVITNLLFARIASISLLLIILGSLGVVQFDKKNKHYFHVEKLFYENKFDEIISYNTQYPPSNLLTIFLNNIALCETDKLNDLLFYFPQSPDGRTLFLKWEMVGEILKRGGYFYYTIGMANEAHRWAFENMVMKGHTPEGLKMLIKTDLINANYNVASSYISVLKKSLFYKKEAKNFEKLLFNDTALNSDPELGEKRRNRLKTDFFSITDDPYINIERILAVDSLNKKAFEYKLAFMLLKKYYHGIENELPRLESFGFTKIPIHIEEAAIAFSFSNNGKIPYTGNIQISRNTQLRWEQYITLFQQYGTDLRRAEPVLRKQFGNTFWYYAFYR
ncbi:MAG TPA: DUF6057 family protein [Bacteroidales bacterium]|nr:DUF6057 family protein [Bacteroidales bacterium]